MIKLKRGKVDPIIGRGEELESLALALGRRQKNNVLMVGDPGVGKTAIAEGLAYNIEQGTVPEFPKRVQSIQLRHWRYACRSVSIVETLKNALNLLCKHLLNKARLLCLLTKHT